MPTLSDRKIRDLKPGTTDKWISDGDGLYIRIRSNGTKTWVIRRMKAGKASSETIGEFPEMDCKGARDAFAKRSFSPNLQKMTLGEMLDEWYRDRIEPRYRVTKNIKVYVDRAKAEFGTTALARLETAPLVRWLKDYAKETPVAANRCASNIKLALNYAVECGYIKSNPLQAVTIRVIGGEEKTRERTLTDDEIKWVFSGKCRPIMRFLLLTGLRISEAREGYLDGDYWRLDRTKNGKPHWVYLPDLAKAQLSEPFDISATAYQAWLRNTAKQTFTPHDLRRTFATRLADLKIAPHIIEKCLNHSLQGVMGIYNRADYADERIAAAQVWEAEVKRITAASVDADQRQARDGRGKAKPQISEIVHQSIQAIPSVSSNSDLRTGILRTAEALYKGEITADEGNALVKAVRKRRKELKNRA